MSKIQDAIRKLQSLEAGRNTVPSSIQDRPNPVATVVRTTELNGSDTLGVDNILVDIDYDLLFEAGLLAPTKQQRHISDQYRLIKRPLLENASGRGAYEAPDANLIMVASPLPGDGKTFNCINLALSMATERDKSVLLVDADVAKPHISSLFGLNREPGLIDLLTDDSRDISQTLLKTSVPGLRILPAGRHDEHATELLASRRMVSVVDVLSKTYPDRVVIFDSPPLLATSESRVLASQMGQIVLVICSGVTPQDAVLEAIESLDQQKAISVVLNQSSHGFGNDGYGGYGFEGRPERLT